MRTWLKPLIPTLAIFVSLLALVPACASLPTIDPAVIGQWQLPGNPQHPAVTAGVSGVIDGQTYLFLAAFDSLSEQTTLHVLSLKDPQNPVEVGSIVSMTPMVLDMELSGDLLYISGITQLLTVDVSFLIGNFQKLCIPCQQFEYHHRGYLESCKSSRNGFIRFAIFKLNRV